MTKGKSRTKINTSVNLSLPPGTCTFSPSVKTGVWPRH